MLKLHKRLLENKIARLQYLYDTLSESGDRLQPQDFKILKQLEVEHFKEIFDYESFMYCQTGVNESFESLIDNTLIQAFKEE